MLPLRRPEEGAGASRGAMDCKFVTEVPAGTVVPTRSSIDTA